MVERKREEEEKARIILLSRHRASERVRNHKLRPNSLSPARENTPSKSCKKRRSTSLSSRPPSAQNSPRLKQHNEKKEQKNSKRGRPLYTPGDIQSPNRHRVKRNSCHSSPCQRLHSCQNYQEYLNLNAELRKSPSRNPAKFISPNKQAKPKATLSPQSVLKTSLATNEKLKRSNSGMYEMQCNLPPFSPNYLNGHPITLKRPLSPRASFSSSTPSIPSEEQDLRDIPKRLFESLPMPAWETETKSEVAHPRSPVQSAETSGVAIETSDDSTSFPLLAMSAKKKAKKKEK